MFLLWERAAGAFVSMREFVRVLCASIMYLDNATASLYQEQLTGIAMHNARRSTRARSERHEAAEEP